MVSLTGLTNRDLNSLLMPYNSTTRGSGGTPKNGPGQALSDSIALNPSLANGGNYTVQILVEQVSIQFSSVTGTTPAVQNSVGPLGLSAEATAQRIFDFSTSLFGVYQSQNPDKAEEAALADFEQLVSDAVERGFEQARSILDGLGKLDDPTTEFLTNVHSLLDALLDAFFHPEDAQGTGESETSEGEPADSWTRFELDYKYFYLEFTSTGRATSPSETSSAPGGNSGAGNASPASILRFQAESLRIALSYSQGVTAEPDLQLLA